MQPVSAAEVAAARDGLAGHVRRTPVLETEPDRWLKLELLQRSGSFKARGATWRLLAAGGAAERGVVAASGGNFGIAVADAAARLGVPATIFVATVTASAKVIALRDLGADVVVVPGAYPEALAASVAHAQRTGALIAHAYDQREVVAGAGTMAAELDDQAPCDTVVVACGGGGLLAGVLAWCGDRVRVVAVETPGTSTLTAALAAGGPVDVEVAGRCADSLGAGRLGALAWAAVERWGVVALVVDDGEVEAAQRDLWSAYRLVAEPGGAAAFAALQTGAYRPAHGERVVVVVCGGNVDPATVA